MKPLKVDVTLGVTELNGIPVVSSRKVAEVFNKRHDNILRNIENIKGDLLKIEEIKWEQNFIQSSYMDSRNRCYPEYLMTKDGFTLLAMGFTGAEAMKFKIAYIKRFNEMEQYIKSLAAARMEFPQFTQAIRQVHEEPRHYHFSNECNLINRVVLGMDAKKFRETNGLGKVSSIRPYLTAEQISSIEQLQRADIGLLLAEPDYGKRKMLLEWYYSKISIKQIGA